MKEAQVNRIFFSRIFEDEDLLEAIKKRVEKADIKAGFLFAIGSLKRAVLGFYKDGKYKPIPVKGPLEITSCIGNLALKENGEVIVHAHLTVSNEKGEAFGGHLLPECIVAATAELVLVEASGIELKREFDVKTNLYLLSLDE